jgi:hypothetical protein
MRTSREQRRSGNWCAQRTRRGLRRLGRSKLGKLARKADEKQFVRQKEIQEMKAADKTAKEGK